MAATVEFHQIYYKDEQLPELYPFARPYKNEVLTPYFENTIIAELVPTATADLVSVCSWMLKRKRGTGSTEVILNRGGRLQLSEENILNLDYDIAILTPRHPSHNILEMAENWHGQAWTNAIAELKKILNIPETMVGNAIYENHFIARREIYQAYVKEYLIPVMEYMEGRMVFHEDANYNEKVRDNEKVKHVTEKLSQWYGHPVHGWPIGVFVLERLFRIWIEGKDFKIINL